jgi:hypothetical protein
MLSLKRGVKIALTILISAVAALGQQNEQNGQPVSSLPPACGPAHTSFKVKVDDTRHDLTQPDTGKARVYFIHEAGIPFTRVVLGYPTSKFAMDGAWVGANHGDSWFSVSVDPGEHHVCTTLQSSLFYDDRVELAHFTAEPGKVYYYRTRLVLTGSVQLLELEPLDSDQAEYMVSTYPMSISTPKK